MLISLGVLLLCQLIGEASTRAFDAPVPGPVIGMVLMLVMMVLRERLAPVLPNEVSDGTLEKTSTGLLSHLSLMFIPAGVGVVQRLDLVVQYGFSLFIALFLSTAIALLCGVAAFRLVARLMEERE